MAELTQKERLQPSLLDRLTDDAPGERQESREKRVLSVQKLRQSVLRDMSWLLNARSLESLLSLEQYPEVAKSVVNFGLKDLSGTTITGADTSAIERRLKQAIQNFEPRIIPHSLKVTVTAAEDKMNHQAMSFDIEGELWAQPLPVHLYIRTEIDIETGDASLRDLSG
ncbi:type VI secretion system baseplate subunit TssE [Methylocaldum sp.]|uniref:type VI secretion system baseplate subunit TssE n=1 Tax=Methylocaldum sp. TaxID=1969727 RepID=UPI002D2B05DF|nr:type VI secretion system baseplate subunit TssE [Methylocaldum sp.]HYE34298.1 type VI secretion system baseplate subunit TssE [Methylocaldum sp.]